MEPLAPSPNLSVFYLVDFHDILNIYYRYECKRISFGGICNVRSERCLLCCI
jgi:hypothetical protein